MSRFKGHRLQYMLHFLSLSVSLEIIFSLPVVPSVSLRPLFPWSFSCSVFLCHFLSFFIMIFLSRTFSHGLSHWVLFSRPFSPVLFRFLSLPISLNFLLSLFVILFRFHSVSIFLTFILSLPLLQSSIFFFLLTLALPHPTSHSLSHPLSFQFSQFLSTFSVVSSSNAIESKNTNLRAICKCRTTQNLKNIRKGIVFWKHLLSKAENKLHFQKCFKKIWN